MVDTSHDAPWFKFYAGDWLSDTELQLMPLRAQGAYVRLLCHQWIQGDLPKEMELLAKLCGTDDETMGEMWTEHLNKRFKSTRGDRLVDPDLEETREEVLERKKQLSDAGKRGAAKKHGYDSVDEMLEEKEPLQSPT